MLTFVLISLLLGMVLGQRFKVLVLLPAMVIALLASTIAEIAGTDHWRTLLISATAVVALQAGYLTGYGIRRAILAPRMNRLRGSFIGYSRPVEHRNFDAVRKST